jgi:multiple sugar transport system permease protein
MHERLAWLVARHCDGGGRLCNVWRGIPFFAIMLLAGLQSVPDELYEAAHVDGAGVLAVSGTSPCRCCGPSSWSLPRRGSFDLQLCRPDFVMTGGGPANPPRSRRLHLAAGLFEPRLRLRRRALIVLLVVMLVFTASPASPRA